MFRLFGKSPERKNGQEAERVPPGQKVTRRWPVMHAGVVPAFNEEEWSLRICGEVNEEREVSWQEFCTLPQVKVTSDVHCVTGWTLLDNVWEGVSSRNLLDLAELKPEVEAVMVRDEQGYAANMPLDVFLGEAVLFATRHGGKDLSAKHGGPVRLVVPSLYFWKSVKWVRTVELLAADQRGFWEQRGYHSGADPWKEQRYRLQETSAEDKSEV